MSAASGGPARKRGLGMGLSALLGPAPEAAGDRAGDAGGGASLRRLPVERLHPSPHQPRLRFPEPELEALAASVRERGILQPLVVRPAADGRSYEIVAGERRWRAAQRAGLHEVPALVRELDDREALELALVENVQRQDLNPLEEARGYRRLLDEFGYTQEALGVAVGKSRPHVANLLRLLQLPEEVQDLVLANDLTAGHARALVGTAEPARLAREVQRRGLSVRDTERLAEVAGKAGRRGGTADGEPPSLAADRPPAADLADAQARLAARLGLEVAIRAKKKGGILVISYQSNEQLDLLIDRLISGG